jgi:hypothetical protein|tara:strand:+ start:518 stop:619 length:102 start_codon:yes stop_codon:yes gene_type:complete
MKAGEAIAKMFYFVLKINLFEESPGSHMVRLAG